MPSREDLKEKILKRALIHVPFDGWSKNILEQAAVEEGLDPSYSWRLFPKGPHDAIALWSKLLDQEMLALLPSPEGFKIREKVALGVKTRLSLLTPHKEAARKTGLFLAMPPHVALATRLIYRTVDEIWHYAGDTSTDYNYYTKRGLLAWVYSATFLYWLKDTSEDHEKTWVFLEKRIEEVLKLPKIPQKILHTVFRWKRHG